MKICSKCKKEYDNTWRVCLQCGLELKDGLDARLDFLEGQAKKILTEIAAIRKGESGSVSGDYIDTADMTDKAVKASSATAPKEDTETRIGKYILNKIGIISVVAGVSFFLAYAFKYLSPLFKIFVGYLISAGMALLGKMTERLEKYKWYGRGLICGGWILAYFTAYAMYHIKATKIISSRSLDLILVSFIVIAMFVHLSKYRSQALIALVMLLGYMTAGINQYALSAFIYITILVVVSSVLFLKMNWQKAAAFSLLGAYITHLIWVRPYADIKPEAFEFWINIAFLASYWSIYNIVSLFIKTRDRKEETGIDWFILTNSLLFGLVCFMQVNAFNSSWKFPFALSAAVVMSGWALAAKYLKDNSRVKTAFFVAAIAFLTVSLRFSLGRSSAYFIWFCEIPALLFIGFYMKNILYRIAAWALTVIVSFGMMIVFGIPDEKMVFAGREMPIALFIYIAGVVCLYLSRYAYLDRPVSSDWDRQEIKLSNSYTILASVVLLCVSYYEISTKLVTLNWAISAMLLFVVGFFIKDKVFRYSAIGFIAAALLRVITVDLAGVNTGYRIIVFICLGLVLLAVSFWYAKMSGAYQDKETPEGKFVKLAPVIMPLIAISVLGAAYLYPSEFRRENKLNGREIEITARFMAGKEIADKDLVFLRERKFKNLEQALRSLPIGKEGYNLGIYIRAIDMGVRSPEIYSRLAAYYAEKGESVKAIEAYEKGIALDPELKQWNTRYMVRSTAKLYRAAERYEKAAAYYEKYIVIYKNVEDLYELAICYERLGKLDKALEKLNEALRMDQGGTYSSEISSLRSDIYGKKEMLEKSQVDDKKIVE